MPDWHLITGPNMRKMFSDINLLPSDSVCYSLRKAHVRFWPPLLFGMVLPTVAKGRTFKNAS